MPIGIYKHKPCTEETKEKIRLANIGRKHTEEAKEKLRLFHIGLTHTEETKRKIGMTNSIVLKGKSVRGSGWKHSEETRVKMKQARLRQILPYKDTSIEIKLQNWLKEQKIEFQTHYPILGQPDIFIKPNICIFADGCYWHKCSDCGFGHGRERDVMVTRELQKQGYIVIRLWEHEIKNNRLGLFG